MQNQLTTRFLLVISVAVIFCVLNVPTGRASPAYYCYRVEQPICIDGRLDEQTWKDVPFIEFHDIADGSAPKYSTRARILWDDNYLYVSFDVEEPNVWAVVGKQIGEPRQLWEVSAEAKAKFLLFRDSFLKVFLDPDGDGKNYLEFLINALGNINDVWFGCGSRRTDRQQDDFSPKNYHLEWDCADLKSAVDIRGTLNNPEDIDKGWSVEMAFPWASLSSFTAGRCPPAASDTWRAHLGRLYRIKDGAKPSYWTWPVIGIVDCHQLDRWGFIIFSGDNAVKKETKTGNLVTEEQLQWKMVWVWRREGKSDEELVALAKSLGFNAMQAKENMIEICHRAGMQAFGTLWLSSAPQESVQVILPREQKRLAVQTENPTVKKLYQNGGEPVQGGEIHGFKPWCLDQPETLKYCKQCIDKIIAAGYDGIALDGIGYRNYYACFCPVSQRKHKEFIEKHPKLSPEEAVRKYSEQRLVSFNNELINYAKQKKADIKITTHIWPHFAPNPLYGNKLAVDYCGQTVSWFRVPHWPLEKVERYAYEVVSKESLYHRHSKAAPFIGIFTLPPEERHKKTAERVREEIRIVKRAGAKAIQFAELGNILNDPEIAKVVSEELGGTWKADK